ncbi:DUF4190 domain-containing protein [Isoptericola aurantiacus]|uniref:DUF4190 domain-containing protein n=1 Tax=Isoptericola aurantiacus TaxID=3377839 RepID=UPI00383A053A
MTTPGPNVPQDPYDSQQPPPGPYPGGQPAPGPYPGGQPAPGPYPGGQPAPGYGQPPTQNPGTTFGIVGLVLGFLGPLSLVGLILSIVGLRKSKKAGQSNGVAIAGIVVSSLVLIGVIIGGIALGVGLAHVIEVCNDLGPGTHVQDGITYTCS